jgi:hypothetical protein
VHKILSQIAEDNSVSSPLTQWDLSSGVGPLWIFVGCFANNVRSCVPVVVHAWMSCLDLNDKQSVFGLLRAKLILATLGRAKMILILNEPI